jgi:regulator of sigma E protease
VSIIILLGVLIFVHELGHFLVAKYFNVKVLRFSLGFGPRLIGKTWGETEYRLSLIPLGGYVNLMGQSEEEEVPEEEKHRSFCSQSVLRRMAIVAAGPLFNFFWAIIVLAVIYMYGIPALSAKIVGVMEKSPAFKAGLMENDVVTHINGKNVRAWNDMTKHIEASAGSPLRFDFKRDDVRYFAMVTPIQSRDKNLFGEEVDSYTIGVVHPVLSAKIGRVMEKSPAFKAGLMKNDVITHINGKSIGTWSDMTKHIEDSAGSPLKFDFKRDDARYSAMVAPVMSKGKNHLGEEVDKYMIGVEISKDFDEVTLRFNPVLALWKATKDTAYFSYLTVAGLGKMVVGAISPRQNLGGPIAIFQMAGEAARIGVITFLHLMALISISLAVINLFPVPILDGGHLLFFFIELCKGSPVSVKCQEYAYKAGLAILIMLMIFVFWNDLDKIFPGFLF